MHYWHVVNCASIAKLAFVSYTNVMTVGQPNSGFESCFFNLPDLSQELNIDAHALKEVNVAVRQILVEDQDCEKRGYTRVWL